MKRDASYLQFLRKSLRDPKEAAHYLSAALEEEDPAVFLLALKDVAQAHGGMTRIAKKCGLNRVSMYRMLSERGNPALLGVEHLLNAMGLHFVVTPKRT
jgi:probable addiction module antidote protein